MNLTMVAPEILINILGNSNPNAIKSFRQVTSPSYPSAGQLTLHALPIDDMGYQPPTTLRRDLGFTQMIQVLRNHKNAWYLSKELGSPSFINISSDSKGFHSFVDGVFAYTSGSTKSGDEYSATIHFHQLPSINRGAGYKHWYHQVNCNIKYIAIQPELDLLVMLSYKGGSFSPDTVPHQLHLRTISTNDPHPVAASPIIDLKVSRASRYQLHYQDDLVQIHGRMIGVRFGGYRNPTLKPLIMVWNWVTGIEVVHLELRPRGQYSMTFLSEKYILVPELAAPIAGTTWSYNQLGRLDIYQVPLDKGTESLDYPIANFILPEPAEQQNSVHLRVSTSPAPAPESAQLQPKIYEMPLENRYIHIYISTSIDNDRNDPSWRASSRPGLHGLLYVSTGTLLDFLNQVCHSVSFTVPVSIPWSEWGCQASWVSWPSAQYMNGFSWGHRHAFRYEVRAENFQTRCMASYRFCILDHNRSQAKLASCASNGILEVKRPERQEVGPMTDDTTTPLSKEAAEQITFREALSLGARYTEAAVRMEGTAEFLRSNGLTLQVNDSAPWLDIEPFLGGSGSMVIDDEHFVVLVPKGPSTPALTGLLVYNIGRDINTPDASEIVD